MLSPKDFHQLLSEKEIDFFTGVPDSLLKEFCAYLTENIEPTKHITAANEGNAIALAAGHHLATGKTALVYQQNSGQGNSINPLVSLTDPDVYNIPVLLLIGWRGEPGLKDEPQHVKQGKITIKLLETLNIPYNILPDSLEDTKRVLENALNHIKTNNSPFAIIVKKDSFEPYQKKPQEENQTLTREETIKIITNSLDENDAIISTTGKTSRELFEHRISKGEDTRDFLTVGSMGHSSQIALGVALAKPNRQVYCFDGDGAVLMHMGSLAIIGSTKPKNFKHIVFNNGAHDSVGGQPTAGFHVDFCKIAEGCKYSTILRAETREQLVAQLDILKNSQGPTLLEVVVKKGARKDLGRPTSTPKENKKAFMKFLQNDN